MKDNRNIGMKPEVEQDLRDICLELTDEGFVCSLRRTEYGEIVIFKGEYNTRKEFKYNDISDVVDRVTDYMTQFKPPHDYKVKVIKTNDRHNKTFIGRLKSFFQSERVDFVRIKFRNLYVERTLDDILNHLKTL